MNIPAIRKALTALRVETHLHKAVVRVGLRACDEAEGSLHARQRDMNISAEAAISIRSRSEVTLYAIAGILRESGVEVEG